MKNSFLVFVFFAFILSSCKLDDGTIVDQEPDVDENITVATNLDNDLILKLVNNQRTVGCNCGTTIMPPVPALTWSNLLAAAALVHSKDMNKNKFFEHTSSDGKTTAQRVTATGYRWKYLAENLGFGQIDEYAVVAGWMASESHCKNVMTANFKEMGVARDGLYWTQEFGAKMK